MCDNLVSRQLKFTTIKESFLLHSKKNPRSEGFLFYPTVATSRDLHPPRPSGERGMGCPIPFSRLTGWFLSTIFDLRRFASLTRARCAIYHWKILYINLKSTTRLPLRPLSRMQFCRQHIHT